MTVTLLLFRLSQQQI